MATRARQSFDENLDDIAQLIDYYKAVEKLFAEGGETMPHGADVVLRSAIVLLITYWEAYVEDLASEAIEHLVKNAETPDKLPKELRKSIARELMEDKNDIAVWTLAGDGWCVYIQERLPKLKNARDRSFNTPKSAQTRDFFSTTLGIKDITSSWVFEGDDAKTNCSMLDSLVELRGKIAHRGKLRLKVNVKMVESLTDWIKTLVSKTGGCVNREIEMCTGKPLWKSKK